MKKHLKAFFILIVLNTSALPLLAQGLFGEGVLKPLIDNVIIVQVQPNNVSLSINMEATELSSDIGIQSNNSHISGGWPSWQSAQIGRPASAPISHRFDNNGKSIQLSLFQVDLPNFVLLAEVYPTLASQFVTVRPIAAEYKQMALYNISGQLIFQEKWMGQPQIELDVQQLPNGVYVLHMYSDTQRQVQKLVIAH